MAARAARRCFTIPTSTYAKTCAPAVVLRVASGGQEARLRLRVNEHINPEAAEHFLRLCAAGEGGYRGARFVNNLAGFYLETEERDIGEYLDESYPAAFNRAGMVGLSKAAGDAGRGRSGGGFFIALRRLPDLGRFVWVAQVVEGLEALRALDPAGPPRIVGCEPDGEAPLADAHSPN